MVTPGESPHLLLGRVRFLLECIECFRETKPLPEALCYVPRDVYYKICKDSSSSAISLEKNLFPVWELPSQCKYTKKLFRFNIEVRKGTCIRATGEEYWNSYGMWVKMNKEQLEEYNNGCELEEGWILMYKHTRRGDRLVPVDSPDQTQKQQLLYGYDYKPVTRWEQVVDATYSHSLGPKMKIAERDEAAVQRLRYVPPTWTYECDEHLVHCLSNPAGKEAEDLGSATQYLDKIEVSTNTEGYNASCLTDGFTETYWESSIGWSNESLREPHWIRLHVKKFITVKKLNLILDKNDDSFLPRKVAVYGGELDNLKELNEFNMDETVVEDICILEDVSIYMPIIEIRILECKDGGLNVRIRGINIQSARGTNHGLNVDMFQPANLIRYPRLEGTDPDVLYRRAQVIQRFATLLDSLLNYLVPTCNQSIGTFLQFKYIKQFLLLSKRRSTLITQCLKDSESNKPDAIPTLNINRRLAMEHRSNPALDPSYKNSVFSQIYEGLKHSDKCKKNYDYRWSPCYTQWWECKFISEGIVDHGGGFRDSLSDISEELCPSSADSSAPLPFFVRTSNQGDNTGESRDMYVPNPSCKDFAKYEWIGQLMGAMFRGKEFLVLALPAIVWKQLTGEAVIWSKDFPAVDSVLVKLLEALENMDKEMFEFKFGDELMYTTVLSDQRVVELIPGGSSIPVKYEDRKEFIRLVKKARLEESKKQIAVMRAGLVKVVPHVVLALLPWQELEKKVSGDPEITVEALKRSTRCENLSDTQVKFLWEALTNFTSEDRSRLLRFITGRSRLPAPINICPHRSDAEAIDALPESSTCGSTLYLPNYSSAKICEEKLRYAAYNCVAIDTDMTPWED